MARKSIGFGLMKRNTLAGQGGRKTSVVAASYLDSIISSTEFDIDFTVADSFDGTGQDINSLTASPASGATQAAYKFYRGSDGTAEASDPTFNGSAGDSAAYISFDGADWCDMQGSNTTFLNNIHKTTSGNPATIIIAGRAPASIASNDGIFTTENNGSNAGIAIRADTGGGVSLFQWNNAGNSRTIITPTLTANADFLLAIAVDYEAGTLKSAINSATFTTETLVSGTATGNTVNSACIGAYAGTHVIPLDSGYRVYGVYGFNEVLSDANLALAKTHLEARHNRSY